MFQPLTVKRYRNLDFGRQVWRRVFVGTGLSSQTHVMITGQFLVHAPHTGIHKLSLDKSHLLATQRKEPRIGVCSLPHSRLAMAMVGELVSAALTAALCHESHNV